MLGLSYISSLKPVQFVLQRASALSRRHGRLVLVVLTGFSISMLAVGYYLQLRRRRYRAVSTASTLRIELQHQDTFADNRQGSFQTTPTHSANHVPLYEMTVEILPPKELQEEEHMKSPLPDHTVHFEEPDMAEGVLEVVRGRGVESAKLAAAEEEVETSSDDSFHSTLDLVGMEMAVVLDNQLYQSALELVGSGQVKCRKIRADLLSCADKKDFLAKVHCVRLAFDGLVQSSDHRDYFAEMGRTIMSNFLRDTNQDPSVFVTRFDALISFMESEEGWVVAEKELTVREVVCMNVYDIALDFILLDAFEDLENPPGTIVAVLQNKWITTGMKTSALSAAIWSISKAKKSMLKHKNGFMSQFYSLSETITPTLAWGFLGTDQTLKDKCSAFKSSVQNFVRTIFSLEEVRYHNVASLSDDILRLAQQTAHDMHNHGSTRP